MCSLAGVQHNGAFLCRTPLGVVRITGVMELPVANTILVARALAVLKICQQCRSATVFSSSEFCVFTNLKAGTECCTKSL